MQTPAFSTTAAGELLVAFVAYDGPAGSPQTATVSGAGLIWTLLKRSNAQSGTAEIWAAKSIDPLTNVTVISQPGIGTNSGGSLTVIAFANASGPGVSWDSPAPPPELPTSTCRGYPRGTECLPWGTTGTTPIPERLS